MIISGGNCLENGTSAAITSPSPSPRSSLVGERQSWWRFDRVGAKRAKVGSKLLLTANQPPQKTLRTEWY